jgi:hypothetical protein
MEDEHIWFRFAWILDLYHPTDVPRLVASCKRFIVSDSNKVIGKETIAKMPQNIGSRGKASAAVSLA